MSTYEEILGNSLNHWYGPNDEDPIAEHLVKVGEVDLREPDYSFDLLAFWVRKRDGQILYAADSGCSCPSPFEDVTVGELKETTLAGVLDVARREAYGPDAYSAISTVNVVQAVRDLVPAMREAGAR